MTCLVPEGVAPGAVDGLPRRRSAAPGAAATRGALTVRVLPFVAQPDYDKLLWACDFNFVRGEDSFVRAQWAGKPFVWHIYPQDENLHHVKLRAFLQRYAAGIDSLVRFFAGVERRRGDGPQDWPRCGRRLQADLPHIARRAGRMAARNAGARRPGAQHAELCRARFVQLRNKFGYNARLFSNEILIRSNVSLRRYWPGSDR